MEKEVGGLLLQEGNQRQRGVVATCFVAWLIGGEIYNNLNAGGIDSQSRSSNLSRGPSPQGTVGIYELFAGDKDDFLSGDEVSDLEGEMTATITEISIPNRTCQRL